MRTKGVLGSLDVFQCVGGLLSNFALFISLLPAEVEAECEAAQTKYHVLFALTLQTVFFSSPSIQCCITAVITLFHQPKQVGKQDFCICLELL